MKLAGFTLIEVLIAVVLLSVVLVVGISLPHRYLLQLQWQRLYERFERSFQDANTYALTGFSAAGGNNESVSRQYPDRHHLYVQTGSDSSGVWYLESRSTGDAREQREVVFQEYWDFDLDTLQLEDIRLMSSGFSGSHSQKMRGSAALISWSSPFAQLSFEIYEDIPFQMHLDDYQIHFLPEPFFVSCEDLSDFCELSLLYRQQGIEHKKGLVVDLHKGIWRTSFGDQISVF